MAIDAGTLAALDAAGALDREERRAFERALATFAADVRAEVAACREAAVAIAESSLAEVGPAAHVRDRLMSRIGDTLRPAPPGFSFRFAHDDDWVAHRVPGVRMKVLAVNRGSGYAALLLDLEPGVRYPAHHHAGAEECFVLSGSLFSGDRRFSAGDFLHAEADTDHGGIWTDEGCRVLLMAPAQNELPPKGSALLYR